MIRLAYRLSVLAIAVLVFAACATVPPRLLEFGGTPEIVEGEPAQIYWNFKDCDSVLVEGHPAAYLPKDTITVSPSQSKSYTITAMRGSKKTVREHTIIVVPPPAKPERSFPAKVWDLPISTTTSRYFAGAVPAISPLMRVRLKTMRVLAERDEVHAVVLDDFGNFVSGIDPEEARWTAAALCSNKEIGDARSARVSEVVRPPATPAAEVVVCADVSAAASDYHLAIMQASKAFFKALPPQTIASFIPFSHRYSNLYQRKSAKDLPDMLSDSLPKQFGGLTALYLTAFQSLALLSDKQESGSYLKVMVIFIASRDNASISYLQPDVLELAKQHGVIIYPILIGPSTDGTALSHLATSTGGVAYSLGLPKPEEIVAAATEIARSLAIYYSIVIPAEVQAPLAACTAEKTGTALRLSDGASAADTATIRTPWLTEYPLRQILALFDGKTDDIDSDYDHQFFRLANLLADNPTKMVELTGHSSLGGEFTKNQKTGLQRSLAAQKKLVNLGVDASQIRVRSSGSLRPVNYFEEKDWQATMNRRVEVRWLDPSFLPFELNAATVFTEEEAIRLTDLWSERGYNAEYEMVVYDRVTAFIVKLWGFPTLESAVAAKQEIQKRFKERVYVD